MKHTTIWLAVLAALPALASAETDKTIQLDDVTVTAAPTSYIVKQTSSATRTDTPIKETPQSIVVIPRAVLDDQQNVTVSEALRNASAVIPNAEFSTPAFETTRVRGFAAEQLIDGFTQNDNAGDRESLVNVQQLEVLKGANAILYTGGTRAPIGGVVNIVSKLPQQKAFGEIGVKLGSYSFGQTFFDINQPLNENVLTRITGEYTSAESNIDVLQQKRYNINPAITFTNNDTTSLTVQGKFSRWTQQEYQGLPATGTVAGNIKLKSDLFIGPKNIPDSYSEFQGIWATLDHRLNDTWSLTFKTRYAESDFDEKAQSIYGAGFDFAANTPFFAPSTWGLANVQVKQSQREKTVVANANGKFDSANTKNTVLLGADYSDFKDVGFMNADVLASSVDLTNPVFSSAYTTPSGVLINSDTQSKLYGYYGQLQSTIYERLHLLLGLRQAHIGLDYLEKSINTLTETDKDKLLPRVGVVFDVHPHLSVFANYSEGLRGQAYLLFAGTPKPEESRSREAGFKFGDSEHLSGQIAWFEIDRTNVGVGFPATQFSDQRSRGYDMDASWKLNESWNLLANYAHTDVEFTDSLIASKGNKVAGVPEDSGRVWANYRFNTDALAGLSVGAGVYWQSAAFIDNANTYKADSFHTLDAAVRYDQAKYTVALTVKNLTKEDYYQFYNYFGGRVRPDDNTTAYLSGSYKF